MLDSGVDRIPVSRPGFFSRLATTLARLVVPVVALCLVLGVAFLLRDVPMQEARHLIVIDPRLDTGDWLTWGLVVLPAVFFVLNLTSRRYGAALTLTAAFISWLLIGGAVGWAVHEGIVADFATEIAPYPEAAALVGALATAQLVNILTFDWMRGIPWWKAPFLAALIGGFAFSAAFNMRPTAPWDDGLAARLIVESGLYFSWALLQLLPTGMMRRTIRPLPGFGGA
ncbi:MAG: hypothetical protein KF899_02810 [Parvibaculum sp.]|nr:hypothetical protein [Parvibaculum sp.]